ncbi:MAG: hypothetical protein JST16_07125 [Bdellovibrionales bacterium]|nr:hypothetical protein [Bdellovibrionales bacterium]
MKSLLTGLVAACSLSAFAGELDLPNGEALPTGIMVRTDANGNREVFQTKMSDAVKTDAQAVAAIEGFAKDSNKLDVATGSNELDNSSTAAWYWWPTYGYGYGYYGYNYYGYNYFYQPCYSYYYGGFNYAYYYYNRWWF